MMMGLKSPSSFYFYFTSFHTLSTQHNFSSPSPAPAATNLDPNHDERLPELFVMRFLFCSRGLHCPPPSTGGFSTQANW
jgi:hypothetical protein